MERKQEGFPVNSFRICIDGQGNEEIHGKICGVALKNDVTFYNIADLLVKIDDALNFVGTPQSYQKVRSFDEQKQESGIVKRTAKRYREASEVREQTGTRKTVDVVIFTRQHTSWQGIVKDTEGKIIGEFKSDLELVKAVLGK